MSSDGAVVVVGGTRGIGMEIVRHYASAGREVVLHGRSETVDERSEGKQAKGSGREREGGVAADHPTAQSFRGSGLDDHRADRVDRAGDDPGGEPEHDHHPGRG